MNLDHESRKRWLKRRHYELKSSDVGYWVDGLCGFLVVGYFRTASEATRVAMERIKEARAKKEHPTWLFE